MSNTTRAHEATDAELVAALYRGVAAGTFVEVTDEYLAQMAAELAEEEPAAAAPATPRVPLGAAAQLAYAKFLAGLPCHECGASGDQVCAPTCGAGLSAEEKGSYPC